MKFSEFRNREKKVVQEIFDPSHEPLHDIQNFAVIEKINNILGQIASRGVICPSALLSSIQNFLSIYGLTFDTSKTCFDWFSDIPREYFFDLKQFGGKIGYLNYGSDQSLGLDGVTRIEKQETTVWSRPDSFMSWNKRTLVLSVNRDPKTRLYYFTAKIQ